MKLKNLFITLGLTLAVGIGVGAGLGAKQEMKVAKAETAEADCVIYFDASKVSWFTDEQLYARMFGSDDAVNYPDKWVRVTEEGSLHYSFTFKAHYSKMLFARGSSTTADGATDWAAAGVYANDNQTVDINFSSTQNRVKLIDEKDGENKQKVSQDNINTYQNTIAKDDKLYATIDNKDYDWFGASATTSFFLWNDVTGATKVLSTSRISSTSTTVVGQLDAAFTATGFKVVRVASGKTFDGSDWGNTVVWNEGANVQFTSSYASARAIIDRTRTGQWNYTDGFEVVSASYFAKAFSYYFLEATGNYCNGEGGAEVSAAVQGQLSDALVAFEALQPGTKAAFAAAELNHKADGWRTDDRRNDPVSEAASKYWHMTHATNHKKGAVYNDFLSLGETFMVRASGNFEMTVNESNNSATLIIVIISVAAIVAVGGYFLLKKKKEN